MNSFPESAHSYSFSTRSEYWIDACITGLWGTYLNYSLNIFIQKVLFPPPDTLRFSSWFYWPWEAGTSFLRSSFIRDRLLALGWTMCVTGKNLGARVPWYLGVWDTGSGQIRPGQTRYWSPGVAFCGLQGYSPLSISYQPGKQDL